MEEGDFTASTKHGVNNHKIFLIEGTVFGLRVREDFSVTSIMPYTGSLISEISSSVNKSFHRPNKLSLDLSDRLKSSVITRMMSLLAIW